MIYFIRALFIELHNRLDKMISHLDTQTMANTAASEFKKVTIRYLYDVKKKVLQIKESGILDLDIFTRNMLIKYNSINNEFLEIELFRYLPISKYDENADGYFGKIIRTIYDQIQCLQSPPFISTISNSEVYYWAYSKYNMIALPQGEEKYLLNLSDLYHEIGHLNFIQNEPFLVNEHLERVNEYYATQKKRGVGRKNRELNRLIDNAIPFWQSSWSEELACDLIGTFLVGPAYAWSNLKICAANTGTHDLYLDKKMFKEHPPDRVRMYTILKMLELLGYETASSPIKKAWDHFLLVTRPIETSEYDVVFPQVLIDSLVTNVFEGCNNMALKSYPQQLEDYTLPVSKVINEAWDKIRNDPENFNQWEADQIKILKIYS